MTEMKVKDTIYASFLDIELAEKAGGALHDIGVKPEHIAIVTKNRVAPSKVKENAEVKHKIESGVTTTTAEDAVEGAAKGTLVGMFLGELALIGSLFIPGVGFVTGGGALMTALGAAAGTMAAGGVTGGVVGYLREQGVPAEMTTDFERAIEKGGALMAIDVQNTDEHRVLNVISVLTKYRADVISTTPAGLATV